MKKTLTLILILALCTALLCFGVAAENHSDHSSWTELTAGELAELDYKLNNGSYYLAGDTINSSAQLTINGNVTLCLNDVSYCYSGTGAAINVNEGAHLTVCCCQEGEYGYKGEILSAKGSGDAIENHGTLTVESGSIVSSTENSAAIRNYGVLVVSGGSITANAKEGMPPTGQTAYGIYNERGASLKISGLPSITGSAPGPVTASGPQHDILTYDEIDVSGFDIDEWFSNLESSDPAPVYNINFQGGPDDVILSGLSAWNTYASNNVIHAVFHLTYPENAETIYDEQSGTLSLLESTSLKFCNQNVFSGKYYKVQVVKYPEYPDLLYSQLQDGTADDYDIYWDEESKTLTLNTIYATAHRDYFEALFLANCNETLTVQLIGDNVLEVISALYPGEGYYTYAIESAGDILFKDAPGQSGSLDVRLALGNNSDDIGAVLTPGDVENQSNFTVMFDEDSASNYKTANVSGVKCLDFTNSGSFIMGSSYPGYEVAALSCDGNFSNSGKVDIDFSVLTYGANGVGTGAGIGIRCGSDFSNSGSISIDILSSSVAQGIECVNTESWLNAVGGEIGIDVGTAGGQAGAVGGRPLSGIYIYGSESRSLSFTNNGDLTVTATSDSQSVVSHDVWPTWLFFDTMGIAISQSSEINFVNTGVMNLAAENGYSAGLYISGATKPLSIENRGTMDITATTMGGENVRCTGIFANVVNTDSNVGTLPLLFSGGSVKINAAPASGYENGVLEGGCMAICLTQLFEIGTAPDGIPNGLQQIQFSGMSISGDDGCIVTGPYEVESTYDGQVLYRGYINTIGSDAGAAQSLMVLPTIPGSVSIEGTIREGNTLSAVLTDVPYGVGLVYQWQSAENAEGPFTDIENATDGEYTLTSSEVGKYVRVIVTPTGEQYAGKLIATTETTVMFRLNIPDIYNITILASEGGAVQPNLYKASAGSNITLSVEPEEGWALVCITVNGERISGTSFIMPACDVIVRALFTRDGALPFTDVSANDWFYGYVAYVYANGLMEGVSDMSFDPNGTMTRAMIWAILARMDGESVTGDGWIEAAREWAMSKGVSDGENPYDIVSREQLATMLWRFAGEPKTGTGLEGWADASNVSGWASGAMAWAVDKGIITGVTGTTLEPQGSARRSEAAAMFMRFASTL